MSVASWIQNTGPHCSLLPDCRASCLGTSSSMCEIASLSSPSAMTSQARATSSGVSGGHRSHSLAPVRTCSQLPTRLPKKPPQRKALATDTASTITNATLMYYSTESLEHRSILEKTLLYSTDQNQQISSPCSRQLYEAGLDASQCHYNTHSHSLSPLALSPTHFLSINLLLAVALSLFCSLSLTVTLSLALSFSH